MTQGSNEDIRQRIANTLAILDTSGGQGSGHSVKRDPALLRRHLAMAAGTLQAAAEAIGELDSQLDAVTAPELDAVREMQRMQVQLEQAEQKVAGLELDLQMAKADIQVEEALHSEDRKRMKELEKRSKNFNKVLMEDDDAFGKFMDQAMDDQERKGNPGFKGH